MLYLRKATEDDLPLMLAWRNNPVVNVGFYTQGTNKEVIDWVTHVDWFQNRNKDWRTFIIMSSDYYRRPIGVVTIGQLDHWQPEIGYYIGEIGLWGQGYGTEAVKLALNYIRNYGRKSVHTTVLETNERSLRLLKSLGFKVIHKAREGEVWLDKDL